jgi:hypothetical protein
MAQQNFQYFFMLTRKQSKWIDEEVAHRTEDRYPQSLCNRSSVVRAAIDAAIEAVQAEVAQP